MSEIPPPDPADPTSGETVSYGADEPVPAEARRSRRGVVIGVSAAVLAVVAGAAVWATTTLSGGGRQPEEVLPATTFAYVKIDLDPAAGQKLAARSFFQKFPSLKDKVGNADSVFDDLLAEVIDDEDLDYRTDVQPWFDKRAGLAAFTDAGSTHVVVALRSKDDAKAKASLDKAVADARADGDNDTSYQLTRGYAILGETDGVAAAVRLARNDSLRDNETYRDDIDRLDGDQIAVAWADVARSFDAAKDAIPFGMVSPALSGQAKGRVVAGLRLDADFAELQGLVLGADQRTLARQPATDLLTGLPANTVAAVSISGLGALVGDATATIPNAFLDDLLDGTGLSIEDDVLPLFGKQTVLAVAPFTGLEDLQAGIVSQVADAARAEVAAPKLELIAQSLGVPMTAEVTGDTFVLALPESYGAELAKGGGGLGSSPRFTKAVGDLNGVTDALYLDVSAAAGVFSYALGGAPDGMTFGAVSGVRGTEGFFRLRVVAG